MRLPLLLNLWSLIRLMADQIRLCADTQCRKICSISNLTPKSTFLHFPSKLTWISKCERLKYINLRDHYAAGLTDDAIESSLIKVLFVSERTENPKPSHMRFLLSGCNSELESAVRWAGNPRSPSCLAPPASQTPPGEKAVGPELEHRWASC